MCTHVCAFMHVCVCVCMYVGGKQVVLCKNYKDCWTWLGKSRSTDYQLVASSDLGNLVGETTGNAERDLVKLRKNTDLEIMIQIQLKSNTWDSKLAAVNVWKEITTCVRDGSCVVFGFVWFEFDCTRGEFRGLIPTFPNTLLTIS